MPDNSIGATTKTFTKNNLAIMHNFIKARQNPNQTESVLLLLLLLWDWTLLINNHTGTMSPISSYENNGSLLTKPPSILSKCRSWFVDS